MGSQFDPRIVKTFVRQLERVQSGDDMLEHWAALQQEASIQRVMTSMPLRKLPSQAGTGPLGRARAASDSTVG